MRRAAGVLLAGVGLTLTAFLFEAAPLFVVGAAFVLLGVALPVWVRCSARGASVERERLPERVLEDESVRAVIKVRRGPLGLPGGLILDPFAHAPIEVSRPLSVLGAGASSRVRVVARFARRGLHRVDPPSLVVRDVLGLAIVTKAASGPAQQLLVLPRTEAVRWPADAQGRHSRTLAARNSVQALASVDVDGLRPYREGTPASRIHWPALARGAGLLERRLQADGLQRPLIVLDPRGSGPPEHLDSAVRAAASLTLELARRGGCRLLLPGERRALSVEPDLVSWPDVHARLAVVQGGPGARAPMLGPERGRGGLLYVAAAPLGRLPAALSRSTGAAGVLVLPAALSGPISLAPSFEVAGCRGYAVGERARRRAA